MSSIHMLAGIPGSGKSHYAKELCKQHRAVHVATDSIRQKLFGDEAKRKIRMSYLMKRSLRSSKHWLLDAM
ncbi:AAA family ATPase [Paenibacillus sp. E194]|uniref:AAA family ATPase n=1 Tax=Paenibacillus sp. E194 TaxID=1458845 RepID=UPI000AF87038|nr:AAA family ATPase [Paenibacillus sp. E194]